MKLVANSKVQGVKSLSGKGKGTNVAFAGDIFEVGASEEQRLIDLGVAVKYSREDPLDEDGDVEKKPARKAPARKAPAGKGKVKSEKAKDGSDTVSTEDPLGEDDAVEKKPALKTPAGKDKSEKAEDGSDTASTEDLGL